MEVLHLTFLKGAKLKINFFKLLSSISNKNGQFSIFLTVGEFAKDSILLQNTARYHVSHRY